MTNLVQFLNIALIFGAALLAGAALWLAVLATDALVRWRTTEKHVREAHPETNAGELLASAKVAVAQRVGMRVFGGMSDRSIARKEASYDPLLHAAMARVLAPAQFRSAAKALVAAGLVLTFVAIGPGKVGAFLVSIPTSLLASL